MFPIITNVKGTETSFIDMFYIPINLYLERLSDEPDHSKEFFVFVSMTESEI